MLDGEFTELREYIDALSKEYFQEFPFLNLKE